MYISARDVGEVFINSCCLNSPVKGNSIKIIMKIWNMDKAFENKLLIRLIFLYYG